MSIVYIKRDTYGLIVGTDVVSGNGLTETINTLAGEYIDFLNSTGAYIGKILGCNLVSIPLIEEFIINKVYEYLKYVDPYLRANNRATNPIGITDKNITDYADKMRTLTNQFADPQIRTTIEDTDYGITFYDLNKSDCDFRLLFLEPNKDINWTAIKDIMEEI